VLLRGFHRGGAAQVLDVGVVAPFPQGLGSVLSFGRAIPWLPMSQGWLLVQRVLLQYPFDCSDVDLGPALLMMIGGLPGGHTLLRDGP
jgi:hypothetical protein